MLQETFKNIHLCILVISKVLFQLKVLLESVSTSQWDIAKDIDINLIRIRKPMPKCIILYYRVANINYVNVILIVLDKFSCIDLSRNNVPKVVKMRPISCVCAACL